MMGRRQAEWTGVNWRVSHRFLVASLVFTRGRRAGRVARLTRRPAPPAQMTGRVIRVFYVEFSELCPPQVFSCIYKLIDSPISVE